MAGVGPNSPMKIKLIEWVSITAAFVSLTLYCSNTIADLKAQTESVRSRNTTDILLIDNRIETIMSWQKEASESRVEMYRILLEISGAVKRIEGRMEKN